MSTGSKVQLVPSIAHRNSPASAATTNWPSTLSIPSKGVTTALGPAPAEISEKEQLVPSKSQMYRPGLFELAKSLVATRILALAGSTSSEGLNPVNAPPPGVADRVVREQDVPSSSHRMRTSLLALA